MQQTAQLTKRMKRRTLLKAAPAAGFLAATPFALRAQSTVDSTSNWRTFEVVTRLEITDPTGQVEAWVPLPLMQKTAWFETLSNDIGGNAEQSKVAVDPVYDAGMATWTNSWRSRRRTRRSSRRASRSPRR